MSRIGETKRICQECKDEIIQYDCGCIECDCTSFECRQHDQYYWEENF